MASHPPTHGAYPVLDGCRIERVNQTLDVVRDLLAPEVQLVLGPCLRLPAQNRVPIRLPSGAVGFGPAWRHFLASAGGVLLTFLAGFELDPSILRRKWQEVSFVGIVGFLAPCLGCAALARFVLHWEMRASWLAGVALSTTSMAVVFAVMLETGFNRTDFDKGVLGACFVNDLGTVLALGLIFARFSLRSAVFAGACVVVLALLPPITRSLARRSAFRTGAIRTKWLLLVLLGLGYLALWAGSEAVLPAYLAGIVLANEVAEDQHWSRRLRTLAIGFLTPFYFLRAGSLVLVPAVVAGAGVFLLLLGGKVASKILELAPVIGVFRADRRER